jgi:uncharacterized membrane protein
MSGAKSATARVGALRCSLVLSMIGLAGVLTGCAQAPDGSVRVAAAVVARVTTRGTVSVAHVACTAASSAITLPVPQGDVGGAVNSESGDLLLGELQHADGSETPATWTVTTDQITPVDLGSRSGFRYGVAIGADTTGQVLVEYTDATATRAASYLIAGSSWTQLQPPSGFTEAFALAISADGYVVGTGSTDPSAVSPQVGVPVVWPPGNPNGVRLRTLVPSSTYVVPTSINAGHDIVGYEAATASSSTALAEAWPNAAAPIPGPSLGLELNEAWWVNRAGTIAGDATAPGGSDHAFVAVPSGPTYDLGTLSGDTSSVAWGINNEDAAVGDSVGADGVAHAFYWTSAGAMTRLPAPAGPDRETAAFGLDDNGSAWGESSPGSGAPRQPTLWTCVGGVAADSKKNASKRIRLTRQPRVRYKISKKSAARGIVPPERLIRPFRVVRSERLN